MKPNLDVSFFDGEPLFVLVCPIKFTTTCRLTNGRPRQFSLM